MTPFVALYAAEELFAQQKKGPITEPSQERQHAWPAIEEVSRGDYSLLEIDREIDLLLDQMQEDIDKGGEIRSENYQRFEAFCEVFGQKVDRIGRFIRVMESRAAYCKAEAARLAARAKVAENKASQTKQLVLYFLGSRGLRKIEGPQFTLRRQKNSVDTVNVPDVALLPVHLLRMEARFAGQVWQRIAESLPPDLKESFAAGLQGSSPLLDEIKQEIATWGMVEGVSIVRGHHLRVA